MLDMTIRTLRWTHIPADFTVFFVAPMVLIAQKEINFIFNHQTGEPS